MDIAQLKAQLGAARKCSETVSGIEFALALPTPYFVRCTFEAATERGRIKQATVSRALLDAAIVGWKGLTTRHLLPSAPPEDIPFSADARAMLLDDRPDIVDELASAVLSRIEERQVKPETANG